MAVKVIIPTPLRVYAAKKDSAEVSAQTVGEALGGLTAQFSELRKHLFTDDGKLRSFVNVYLNDEDIRYMAQEATPVKDGDVVSIVPSIAGGNWTGKSIFFREQFATIHLRIFKDRGREAWRQKHKRSA